MAYTAFVAKTIQIVLIAHIALIAHSTFTARIVLTNFMIHTSFRNHIAYIVSITPHYTYNSHPLQPTHSNALGMEQLDVAKNDHRVELDNELDVVAHAKNKKPRIGWYNHMIGSLIINFTLCLCL